MRFTGKLHTWNDDRGFGFIRPTDGGQDIFVHVSALPKPRPGPEEELTFEVALNAEGKKKATYVRLPQSDAAALQVDKQRQGVRGAPRSAGDRRPRERSRSTGVRAAVVALLVVCGFSIYAYDQEREKAVQAATGFKPVAEIDFRCDQRKHCSQMTSCKEAKFFLNNCPDVMMDGDRDGTPCEQDMCKWWWSD